MTTAETILIQLNDQQVTADAIVQRLPTEIAAALVQPAVVVAAFLCDLETAGFAVSAPLGNPEIGRKLAIWSITPAGKARAAELTA